MTSQGSQLTPKEYREHFWNPACQAADPPIEADVHQARHWHVTLEVRDIYETAQSKTEIERRLRDLIEYMKWKSEETLTAYEHYFEEQRNADTRDDLQKRMHAAVQLYLEERQRGKREKKAPRKPKDESSSVPMVQQFAGESDLAFLYSLAGEA